MRHSLIFLLSLLNAILENFLIVFSVRIEPSFANLKDWQHVGSQRDSAFPENGRILVCSGIFVALLASAGLRFEEQPLPASVTCQFFFFAGARTELCRHYELQRSDRRQFVSGFLRTFLFSSLSFPTSFTPA